MPTRSTSTAKPTTSTRPTNAARPRPSSFVRRSCTTARSSLTCSGPSPYRIPTSMPRPTPRTTEKGSHMHPHAEAPPQNPSTDGDRTVPQGVFSDVEPDRHDDQHRADAIDGRAASPAQSYYREDDTGTPHHDVEPAAIEEEHAQHDPVTEMTAG